MDVQKERQSDRQGVKQLKYTKIGQVQGETRLGSLITRLIQEQRTEEIPITSIILYGCVILKNRSRDTGRILASVLFVCKI